MIEAKTIATAEPSSEPDAMPALSEIKPRRAKSAPAATSVPAPAAPAGEKAAKAGSNPVKKRALTARPDAQVSEAES